MTRRALPYLAVAAAALLAPLLWGAGTTKKTYEVRDEFTTLPPTCGEVAGAVTGYADALYQGTVTFKSCVSVRHTRYSPTTWAVRAWLAGEYDSKPRIYTVYVQYAPFVVTSVSAPGG